MTPEGSGSSRAAEIAAQQVEAIVSAAQAAAEELKQKGRQEAEQIRADGERDAEREREQGRRKAAELGKDARRDAEALVETAERESAQIREQTRRAVEGRVAAAEQAAEQVLSEARALSGGLRRLGTLLGEQGEQILRDVQAAHKRMQADLRVAPIDDSLPRSPRRAQPFSTRPSSGKGGTSRATPEERAAIERAAAELDAPSARRSARRERGNPLDDLDVPSWVAPED